MALRIFTAGLALGSAYGVYEGVRLHRQYPWRVMNYDQALVTSYPTVAMTDAEGVATTIPHPPREAISNPLDTYIAAFYDTWTLRLEGWACRKFHLEAPTPPGVTPTGEDHGSGLYRTFYHSKDELAIFFGSKNKGKGSFGGVQVLTARIDGNNQLEISFASTLFLPPYGQSLSPKFWAMTFKFHQLYTAFLVDSAKRKLERWAKEGR